MAFDISKLFGVLAKYEALETILREARAEVKELGSNFLSINNRITEIELKLKYMETNVSSQIMATLKADMAVLQERLNRNPIHQYSDDMPAHMARKLNTEEEKG